MFLQHLLAIPLLSLSIHRAACVLAVKLLVHLHEPKEKRALMRMHLFRTFRSHLLFFENYLYLGFGKFVPPPLHLSLKPELFLITHVFQQHHFDRKMAAVCLLCLSKDLIFQPRFHFWLSDYIVKFGSAVLFSLRHPLSFEIRTRLCFVFSELTLLHAA